MSIALPNILKPVKCDPNLRNMASSGPRTKYGLQQRVIGDAGYWVINYSFLLRTPAQVRAWRSLVAELRAGKEIDAALFERSPHPSTRVAGNHATLKNAASLRDTEIVLYSFGINVVEGSFIGIDNRLHVITLVESTADPTSFNPITFGSSWDDDTSWDDGDPIDAKIVTIKILPPLRDDYDAATVVKFDDITLRGELADLSQGDTDLELIRRGPVSFTIQESI